MTDESQYPPVPDELVIDDLDGLKAIASPIRMQLIFRFRSAASVADVASAMDVPVTRLYYHVNALVEAGVLEVLETKKKGPQLEKIYRVAGATIRPGPAVFSQAGDPRESAEAAATLILDTTRVELVEALTRHAEHDFDPESSPGAIGRSLAAVPAHLIPKFLDRLNDFVEEFTSTETDDGVPVTFTYVFLPANSDAAPLEKEHDS
jgi:DNA-binding transcriptional ArsR family regulator